MEISEANIVGTFASMPNNEKMQEVAPPYFILDVVDSISKVITTTGDDLLDLNEGNLQDILKFYEDTDINDIDKIKSLIIMKVTYDRIKDVCDKSLEALKYAMKPLVKSELPISKLKNAKGKPYLKLQIFDATYKVSEVNRKGNTSYSLAKLQEYLTQDEIKDCQVIGKTSSYVKIEDTNND